ncbi:MAG: GNAT family N-acetyltransferase [Oscillospiraceae bacterium]|nr:GNAT family N-acetyltransferase [Oscillospiraceae bacterium]
MKYEIINLRERPEWKEDAAAWFHAKWGVPLDAYLESMEQCIAGGSPVPQWYVAAADGRIIGGLGVIENDFHDRKDLTPNVCAVYVEEDCRCQGIAGGLLDHVCREMARRGIDTLYLLTDHTSFYERYGWEFFCTALGDGESQPSRIYRHIMEGSL